MGQTYSIEAAEFFHQENEQHTPQEDELTGEELSCLMGTWQEFTAFLQGF